MVLQLGVGVPAALLLNEAFRGRNLLRGVVLFPYMIPTIVAVMLWKWLLNDSYGLVNHLLVAAGLVATPVAWLGPDWIMSSLVVTSVWQFFPFVVVTYLARLQTIPPELYEAAAVDGASAWRRFVHVTLPQTAAVLFVIVLLRVDLDVHQVRHGVAARGRGRREPLRPDAPVYAYARSFTYLQAGMGAALAVIMFVMLLVATAVYFRVFRTEETMA